MNSRVSIYHAAALFSGRETFFNAALTERLEKRLGYHVILPQRDGYESSQLHQVLADRLPSSHIASAVQSVIYFLDMGLFIPESDVVIANLDEPLDEGVVVEISYARLMGKPVVGFRTDVRSPFGRIEEPLGGLHFFPAYQCNVIINHPMPCNVPDDAWGELERLADRIDAAVRDTGAGFSEKEKPGVESNPGVARVLKGARILFSGIDTIHTSEGLAMVADRYMKNAELLTGLAPRIRNASASKNLVKPNETSVV